ncbi:hypothetical protein [Lentzea sp. CC55]|uniref:hypothetical protein n=1 Tax=Lentzea sp. CC55 TaxID=2884909 RepID=UPI0035B06CB1
MAFACFGTAQGFPADAEVPLSLVREVLWVCRKAAASGPPDRTGSRRTDPRARSQKIAGSTMLNPDVRPADCGGDQ